VILISSAALLSGCAGLTSSANSSGNPPSTLVITNVQTGSVTTAGSQISWTTNAPANSSVDYGTTPSYGTSTPVNSAMATNHQLALTNLTSGTLYHFRVRSTDANNNSAVSGDMTFATAGSTTAPTITTQPASQTVTAGQTASFSVAATGTAPLSYQWRKNNVAISGAISSS